MKRLVWNTALAFVAGFATAFGAFLQTTPKAPDKAALISAAAAAVWAGIRFAYGALSKQVEAVPALPVDK